MRLIIAFLISTFAAGCSGKDKVEAVAPAEKTLEIYTNWLAPGERQAADTLAASFIEANPEYNLVLSGPNGNETLEGRAEKGDFPDAFETTSGSQLWKWVEIHADALVPVDTLARENGWFSAFSKTLLEPNLVGETLYAVPVSIRRTNAVLYNKSVFHKHGITTPTSFEDLLEAMATLKNAGLTPLAVGARGGYGVSMLAWQNVFPALVQSENYVSYFSGLEPSADMQAVRDALERTAELLTYSNSDRDVLEWDQAAELVANGSAAMTIIGDRASGVLKQRDLTAGEEFGMFVLPGGEGTFVYEQESLALAAEARFPDAAELFLAYAATEEAQSAFNAIRGSLPARQVTNMAAFDAIALQNADDFKSKAVVPAISMLTPAKFQENLDAAMEQFSADADVDAVVAVLVENYGLLRPMAN